MEPATSSAPLDADGEELWLAVVLNEEETHQTILLLRRPDGRILVKESDLRDWRLLLPSTDPAIHLGERYYPLDAFAGLTYRVDESAQALHIAAPARLFEPTGIRAGQRSYQAPSPPPPGGFLNYDIVASSEAGRTGASALLEADAFNRWGTGVLRFLRSDAGGTGRGVRLETTWTYDNPQRATSLRLGDAITGTSRAWGGAVRFGGLQWDPTSQRARDS